MRVFLDTNVLASAFAARGLCADLFEVVLLEHELVTGVMVAAELRRSLRAKLKLPASHCDDLLAFLRQAASTFVRTSSPVSARAEAGDAAVLGEALRGRAEIFLTGDAALQRLIEIDLMKILSPRNFWVRLHAGT